MFATLEKSKKLVLEKIPAFPPIVMKVLDLLSSSSVEIADLVDLISSDAVFSAQLLKVANSPLFGLRSQVASVKQAVVTLGLSRVQALAMTVATGNYFKAALTTAELFGCWRHMLATAVISGELAVTCLVSEDLAYTAGLLHDIGRLGLLVAYPHEYAAAVKTADLESLGLLEYEKTVFGMDHCEAGRYLVEEWRLPAAFRIATGRHHEEPSGDEFDLLQVVHYGCALADALGYFAVKPAQSVTPEEIYAKLPEAIQQRFPDDFEALRQTLVHAVAAAS